MQQRAVQVNILLGIIKNAFATVAAVSTTLEFSKNFPGSNAGPSFYRSSHAYLGMPVMPLLSATSTGSPNKQSGERRGHLLDLDFLRLVYPSLTSTNNLSHLFLSINNL